MHACALTLCLLFSSCFKSENVVVDIDHLERTPSPYKVYFMENMESAEKPGHYLKGYQVTMGKVDVRDIKGAPELKDPRSTTQKIIRAAVPPFKIKAWTLSGKVYLKVPFLDWVERGNDDHLLRAKYGDKDWFPSYMDGLDDFRKALIEEYGFHDLQSAYKHIVFWFQSSDDPQRVFGLKGSILKLNADRDDLLPRFLSHSVALSRNKVENPDDMTETTVVTQATQQCSYILRRSAWK